MQLPHMTPARPLLRSMLFIPTLNDKFVDKAHLRGADAIILDLEDSIAQSEKSAARDRLAGVIDTLRGRGIDQIYVRINRALRLAVPDIEAAVLPGVAGLFLPKTDSAQQVRLLSEAVTELEIERGLPVGGTRFAARVETAEAFFRLEEIAAADPRISVFGLGGEDFSMSIGVEPTIETLLYPKQRAIIAARAANVTPIGLVSSGADFRNLDKLREVVRMSRQFGFEGATCIHPAVVPLLNEGFKPNDAEVDKARKLVAAFDAALGDGLASIGVDGKMVDYPVAIRARNLVARADEIRARESRLTQVAG